MVIDKKAEELSAVDIKKAEAQNETLKFVSKFLDTVDLTKFKQTSYTMTVDKFINNKLLGGSSVLKEKYAADPEYPIDSPLKTEAETLMKKLESDNTNGKMQGGFFIFKNVTDNIADHEDATKKALIYRDVEVLTANLDDATLMRFKKLNNTDGAVWNDGTAKNGTKVEGIASKIEGLARVVKYF